jgi:hypothetical protein
MSVFDKLTREESEKMLRIAGEVGDRELRRYRSGGNVSNLHNAVKYGIVEVEIERRLKEAKQDEANPISIPAEQGSIK